MHVQGRLGAFLGLMMGPTAVALIGLGHPSTSRAQTPGEVYVGDPDECSVGDTLAFDAGSTVVNLDAQARLNRALQWVSEAPGRHLLILGADGPRRQDARLGAVRASAVISFLITSGASPIVVSRSDFRDVTPDREYTRVGADTVVVMTCDVAEPVP